MDQSPAHQMLEAVADEPNESELARQPVHLEDPSIVVAVKSPVQNCNFLLINNSEESSEEMTTEEDENSHPQMQEPRQMEASDQSLEVTQPPCDRTCSTASVSLDSFGPPLPVATSASVDLAADRIAVTSARPAQRSVSQNVLVPTEEEAVSYLPKKRAVSFTELTLIRDHVGDTIDGAQFCLSQETQNTCQMPLGEATETSVESCDCTAMRADPQILNMEFGSVQQVVANWPSNSSVSSQESSTASLSELVVQRDGSRSDSETEERALDSEKSSTPDTEASIEGDQDQEPESIDQEDDVESCHGASFHTASEDEAGDIEESHGQKKWSRFPHKLMIFNRSLPPWTLAVAQSLRPDEEIPSMKQQTEGASSTF